MTRKTDKTERDHVMLRMRAAVTYLNSGRANKRTQLLAFLTLQHPELGPAKIMELARVASEGTR